MKFISKSTNLLIVLRPGLSAQPLTGTAAKPTISVRFKDGVAEVQQQELVDMMLAHPGFNGDFISAESVPTDPYAAMRQSSEPAHIMTELKFGTPISKVVGGPKVVLTPEMQKIVQSMAVEMAKAILPSMVESTLKSLVAGHEASKDAGSTNVGATKYGLTKDGKPKERPGRRAKPKAPEITAQSNLEPTGNPLAQASVS